MIHIFKYLKKPVHAIRDWAIECADWVKDNVYTCAALLSIVWSMFFLAVGSSWLVGFWLNGLYHFSFDLASCWQGLLGAVGAIPTLYSLVKQSIGKYRIDSELNSPNGQPVTQTVSQPVNPIPRGR